MKKRNEKMTSKILSPEDMDKRFDSHIMKNQITGNQFVEDRREEIRLKGDFVGETGYVSLDEIVEEALATGKKIILNIGDSSTSGWDSDLVYLNRQRKNQEDISEEEIIFPLFSYKTYSDCLRDLVGEEYIVVNAGIPTHTSLNGYRRLKELISRFNKAGVEIDYVTVYYGNNDSVCNGNLEEKFRNNFIGKQFNNFAKMNKIITRTNVKDYKTNLKKILRYCQKHKIKPILIKPETPLYWEPGRRVKRDSEIFDEEDQAIHEVKKSQGGKNVFTAYQKALQLWKQANQAHKNEELKVALGLYEEARKHDFITPRIKEQHISVLYDLARNENVPLVRINLPREKNDGRDDEGYFIDYCHPDEKANQIYAEQIVLAMKGYHSLTRKSTQAVSDKCYPLF